MTSSKRGSVFLITLTLLTVIFILGFAFTFFTGSEDYSSSMSYESEVAFNLAESAIEEFVARLKNALNDNSSGNQLYRVLRLHNLDVSKEIPLDETQVANLTAYTREIARQVYGIQFGRNNTDSKDFEVKASLKLQLINAVETSSGETVLYKIKQDTKEKQGELNVVATVNYKGHEAKISLTFLIRCVKTFIPPFNYFTLFVRDGSVVGGSNFNTYPSKFTQNRGLRLDNGWKFISSEFNAVTDYRGDKGWEQQLSLLGEEAAVPPGRIFLGQDMNTFNQSNGQSSVFIRSTDGTKLLTSQDYDSNANPSWQMNGQENSFLLFDVGWTGMKDYTKKYMTLQGQEKTTKNGTILSLGGLLAGWSNDDKIRVFNMGSGEELIDPNAGSTSFINCFQSYNAYTQNMISQISDETEKKLMERFTPDLSLSGFHPFGTAVPLNSLQVDGSADFSKLSPTLIYGPVMRQYFRAVQLKLKKADSGKDEIELPYVNEETFKMIFDENGNQLKEDKELTATQAETLFNLAGVPPDHVALLKKNWNNFKNKEIKQFEKYSNFMSDSGMELYNKGLANFINRFEKKQAKYDGPLKNFFDGYLESAPYVYGQLPNADFGKIVEYCPVREFYEGPLAYAMPDRMQTYLFDFYFIPRGTEDFFRGRKTVPIGGVQYDRFDYKYINNETQTLELNGILTLNDSDELDLVNLSYKGHGIIYSSPMMGGGKIAIAGNLLGEDTVREASNNLDTYLNTTIGKNMLTIIAPQIVILTDYIPTSSTRCYVEANLISLSEPLIATGTKPVTIKGTVVTPYLNIEEHFPKTPDSENVIIYNPLNSIWRNVQPNLMDSMYVAKIVTGGIGKFDWKYER